jgi:hypothetical protein
MTQFGRSKPMQDCNDMPLFRGIFAGTLPGQIGTNRDNSPPADAPQSGQFGTPPLKGGVQCPAGTGVGMSRVPDDALGKNTKRNESREAIFQAWMAECRAYDAAGRQDEVPPLPAGYLSSGPKLWREGATYSGKRRGNQWRK